MNISGPKALTDIPPIYFRAFDSYPGILDSISLFDKATSAKNCIDHLLKNHSYEQSIELPSPMWGKLRSLFFADRNHQRLHGQSSLGIGYPMLSFMHHRQLVFAPLLIWPIQLEPHIKKAGQWQLRYQPSHRIQINPYLLNYWQTFFGWNQKELINRYKTYPSLLQKTINELLSRILEATPAGVQNGETIHLHKPFSINPLPELAEVDANPMDFSVHWSAAIGAFPPIYTHLPVQIAALKNESLYWNESSFGINTLATAQATAWNIIRYSKSSVIRSDLKQALPVILYLISNILSNGRTALIVANRQSCLNEILGLLSAHQLDDFAFFFQNKRQDWPLLRKLVNRAYPSKEEHTYDNIAFEGLQSQLDKMANRLKEAYEASRLTIFKGMNFQETLGNFFHHQKQQGKELLNSQLEAHHYTFNNAEYEEIKRAIKKSFPLYQQINTLNHPLEILHPSVLEQDNGEQALKSLSKQLESTKTRFTQLQHRYISVANQYAEALHKYYDSVHQDLSDKHQHLTNLLKTYNQKYGVDFQLTSLASLQLISRFSAKYKKILAAKKEVIREFRQLSAYFEQHAYVDFQFRTLSERRNLAKWDPELEAFQNVLEEWKEVLPKQIKKELLRLSPSRTKESLAMEKEMGALEQALESEINQLNAQQIFQEDFKNVMLTLNKQQSYLEGIVEKIEQTQVFLKDFPIYFQWKKLWTSLSPATASVIRALTKVKPEDWTIAYKSWFLFHRLSQAFNKHLPDHKLPLAAFGQPFQEYSDQLPHHIHALWSNRRERARKDWKTKDKPGYQSFFSHSGEETTNYFSWIDQALQHMDLVTQHLPLWLTSPGAALQLGRAGSFQYDYVILLDGSLQGLQEAQAAFQLGEKIVIIEDPDQKGLLRQQQALSGYVKELPACSFSDATLKAAAEKSSVFSSLTPDRVKVIEAGGSFNEQEEVNVLEAQEVFHLLNEVEQTPQRVYPSVHIVCMTKAQRNLIYGYLMDIKQRGLPGKDKIQQLERNGLAVFALDEIPAPPAHYLILCNTYGLTDHNGKISSLLKRWEKPRLQQQMKILFSQPYQQIRILNAIPAEELSLLSEQSVEYARFLRGLLTSSTQHLPGTEEEESREKSQNVSAKLYFIEEVCRQLKPITDSHRLELSIQTLLSKAIISIYKADDPAKKAVILPDGFWGQTPSTHFTWEYQQNERFLEQGIHVIPTFSADWWKDTNKEIERLTAIIKTTLN